MKLITKYIYKDPSWDRSVDTGFSWYLIHNYAYWRGSRWFKYAGPDICARVREEAFRNINDVRRAVVATVQERYGRRWGVGAEIRSQSIME